MINSAFQVGRSGLTAAQVGIQVTGNNLANAATPGYTRQTVTLNPARDGQVGGLTLGRGVQVTAIRRQVDDALQARLWSGLSNEAAAQSDLQLLGSVESVINPLSDVSVSSQLNRFFNSWSELANTPGAAGTRSLVIQQGRSLAEYLRATRADLTGQRDQVDRDLASNANRANDLVNQIALVNQQLVAGGDAGNGGGSAALRDQRTALVAELAGYVDVTTVEQPSGSLDVLIGSTPVVLAGVSRGLKLKTESEPTGTVVRITTTDNDEQLTIRQGRLGSLLNRRGDLVDDTLSRLDTLAGQLIFEVNKLHSGGYGTTPLTQVRGTLAQASTDTSLAFNDPANQTLSGLPYAPRSGSFLITLTNSATGASQTTRINIDLDGRDNLGQPGTANDTSLQTLVNQLSTVGNLSASITPDGRLSVTAGAGYEMNFADDTSGVLATLGVNTYFTGTDASDIAVRGELLQNSTLLASGRLEAGTRNDNGAARAIADLRSTRVAGLANNTFLGHWDEAVQSVAVQAGQAKTRGEAASTVRESLESQRAAVSGVSVDEEAINLITYQRQYQASARFITVIDEVTQTLLALVR